MSGHFRTEDEEGALDGMTLDEFLVENKEATFLMSMRGDAMEGAGILDGDLLLVDRSREPRRSDIVIAVEDGAFVVRRMIDVAGRQGAESGAKVEAVVRAVIRRY